MHRWSLMTMESPCVRGVHGHHRNQDDGLSSRLPAVRPSLNQIHNAFAGHCKAGCPTEIGDDGVAGDDNSLECRILQAILDAIRTVLQDLGMLPTIYNVSVGQGGEPPHTPARVDPHNMGLGGCLAVRCSSLPWQRGVSTVPQGPERLTGRHPVSGCWALGAHPLLLRSRLELRPSPLRGGTGAATIVLRWGRRPQGDHVSV